MAVSYNKLWKLLIDHKLSAAELGRICHVLGCDYGDIMEHEDES